MIFELVRNFLSQGSPVYWSWAPEPTMGDGASMDQGGHTTHGTRDVSEAVELERYDWSQLARAPITKQPKSLLSTDRNLYNSLPDSVVDVIVNNINTFKNKLDNSG